MEHLPINNNATYQSNELPALPGSIRQRLARVQNLLAEGRPQEAETQMRNVEAELARSHPELFVLLIANSRGYRGIRFTSSEYRSGIEKVKREWFGKSFGEAVIPYCTSCVTTRTIEFF